ncbi:hypothetical protein [Nodularia spumigena]|uniref:Peptidase A2 domain-containing protein n=2 Tax=Nodularia spumigena TaxID=70799 RepID=A0A2S0QAK6_NODSP|nr:hypothetical protein [Nodularia spumigena]AVZ31401.1 hypothetical protein BMF81_04100 [Nodularia spumigena UHCC 0039]MEA5526111.1 hypothetical protein [Nodularia spumigena UHCC 0143]MEA5609002.1 hypothetical protein [Nodularia spumigena UHCC 0060]MEA5613176.1 hypothetical protein [Nodularia spumigena UHCC 0040]
MLEGRKFPFIERSNTPDVSSTMPYLPLSLTYNHRSLEVMALLDTGASVNVLPYELVRTVVRNPPLSLSLWWVMVGYAALTHPTN